MSLCPKSKEKQKCISVKEETSTIEIVESGNCVINIDYFVKDEKISLELYKTSKDAKCVTQKVSSTKSLEKIKACTEINYQSEKTHKTRHLHSEKMNDLVFLKVPEKMRSDSFGFKNEQPVRETLAMMSNKHHPKAVRVPSSCSIFFDGTTSNNGKRYKKSRIHSENTSEESYLQPCSKTKAQHIENIPAANEWRNARKHHTCKMVNEFVSKEPNNGVLLQDKKHAKFEIVLTPRPKQATLYTDTKSDKYSSKQKKLILQSNTLEITSKNSKHEKEDFPNSFEVSLGKGEGTYEEDDTKFYKKRHRKRGHPVVLTMSTTVNANIKGINNIFSELKKKAGGKLLVPHRPVQSEEEEEELKKPFYLPIHEDFPKNKPKTQYTRVTETQETSTEVNKVSQMPRRFIGNDPQSDESNVNIARKKVTSLQDGSDSNKVIVNSDESEESVTQTNTINKNIKIETENSTTLSKTNQTNVPLSETHITSSVQTESLDFNQNEFLQKLNEENFSKFDMMQFCNLMFNMMKQSSTNITQSNQSMTLFMKQASQVFKTSNNNSAINSDKSIMTTKIPRKIVDSGKYQLNTVSDGKEQSILKRATMENELTFASKTAQPKLKVHFKKNSPRRTKNGIAKPATNSKPPENADHNSQAYKTFQRVVKKFKPSKNQTTIRSIQDNKGNQEDLITTSVSTEETETEIVLEPTNISDPNFVSGSSDPETIPSDPNVVSRPSDPEIIHESNGPKVICKTSEEKKSRKTPDGNKATGDQSFRKSFEQKNFRKPLDQNPIAKTCEQKQIGKESRQVLTFKTSAHDKRVTLSARELVMDKSALKTTGKCDTQTKNVCCKTNDTDMKRAKTFCTKTDCMLDIKKSTADFNLLPLVKNYVDPQATASLKVSVASMMQECCREKAKYFHVNKSHTPGCIHNSSFLFTKCNTEHAKESSFQKRKEYNKKWREKYHEKEWKRGLQNSSQTYLEAEKASQLEILRDKLQSAVIINSKQPTKKSDSKNSLSRTKFSGHKLDASTSFNRFSRTSVFSFTNQDKPRKNYAEIDLPSFICPDTMWIEKTENKNEVKPIDRIVEPKSSRDKIQNEEKKNDVSPKTNVLKKETLTSDKSVLKRENTISDQSVVSNASKSTPDTNTIKRNYPVRNKFKNRFITFGSSKKRKKTKQNKKLNSKMKLELDSSCETEQTLKVEQRCNDLNCLEKKTTINQVTPGREEKDNFASNPITSDRHVNNNEIKDNLVTGKVHSDKTITAVQHFQPVLPNSHDEKPLQVVHQNWNFTQQNEDKTSESCAMKEQNLEENRRDSSNDTLLNCISSQIFDEKESEVKLEQMKEETVKIFSDLMKSKEDKNIHVSKLKELNNDNKIKIKKTRLFSLQKVSSHIGKLFRGKKS